MDERLPDGSSFGAPFWRRPPARLGDLMRSSLYAGLLTMQALTPAMVAARRGLVLLAAFEDEGGYLGDPFHDLAQNALVRLAFVAGQELRPYGVTALALSPGFVRTERVVDAGRAAEATESLLYAGRAAAALMADPDVARHARSVVHAADLARAHGFTDEDGAQPARFRLTEG